MDVIACYTGDEARKFLQGAEIYNPKIVKGGQVFVKRIGKSKKLEAYILVIPIGVQIIPHSYPENVKEVTFETMTVGKTGLLEDVTEVWNRNSKPISLNCKINMTNGKMICTIVKVTKKF